jgi:DNA-binding transcriptional ArsR family regulator
MSRELDAVWKALSDPTRRAILDLLRHGPRTTTDVVEAFPHLTRFGVMKHMDVLRGAGLVQTREEGRQRVNSLNAAPIRQIYERWVSRYQEVWSDKLLRIKEDVETEKQTHEADSAFVQVASAFAKDRRVSRGKGKGFGSGALKVNGKIFAMMSSKGKFVVKLPKERVDALVASGQGAYFDPGRGKRMKEWVSIPAGKTRWVELAKVARRFIAGNGA